MLRLGIDPENLYRATFICQDGLCCCNMALISFRLFPKNLGNLGDFFGQMVYSPPWQKISRTPMHAHCRDPAGVPCFCWQFSLIVYESLKGNFNKLRSFTRLNMFNCLSTYFVSINRSK